MVTYEDYEENPWSEDYDEEYHEEDYELTKKEIEEMRREGELGGLSEEEIEEKIKERQKEEYKYDEVVGGRDKKPVLSALNKKRLSTQEMDKLFNKLGEY